MKKKQQKSEPADTPADTPEEKPAGRKWTHTFWWINDRGPEVERYFNPYGSSMRYHIQRMEHNGLFGGPTTTAAEAKTEAEALCILDVLKNGCQ